MAVTPSVRTLVVGIAIVAGATLPQGSRAQSSPGYGQALRPQFHFSPAASFTNDPNGLVCTTRVDTTCSINSVSSRAPRV